MEKITQISINATLFSLEDSAYKKLSSYINEIREAFKNEVGGQEIVKDIEARIAEHLKESGDELITLSLVDEIIEKMGTVSELTGKDKEENKQEKTEPSKNIIEEKFKKRLFRDEDNAILGGVCSGIAAYLDVDPTWIRIAFIALIFLGFGTIIPIYIILWLIVPAAQSTADKLEMRGNQVNLKTIVDTVRDKAKEYSGVEESQNCNNDSCETKDSPVKKTKNTIRKIFMAIGRIGAFFTGALISFTSLAILIGFTAGATAVLTANISPEITDFIHTSGARSFVWLGFLASIICVTIPSMFMFLGGITLIRRKPIVQIRYGFTIFAIWMVSIITLVILGTHYGIKLENYMDQKREARIEQTQNINSDNIIDISTSTPNEIKVMYIK